MISQCFVAAVALLIVVEWKLVVGVRSHLALLCPNNIERHWHRWDVFVFNNYRHIMKCWLPSPGSFGQVGKFAGNRDAIRHGGRVPLGTHCL